MRLSPCTGSTDACNMILRTGIGGKTRRRCPFAHRHIQIQKMRHHHRGLLSAGFIIAASVADTVWLAWAQPQIATHLALEQVNGGAPAWRELLAWQATHQWPHFVAQAVVAATIAWWVRPIVIAFLCAKSAEKKRLPLLFAASTLTGCVKSYDKPEYVEVDPHPIDDVIISP